MTGIEVFGLVLVLGGGALVLAIGVTPFGAWLERRWMRSRERVCPTCHGMPNVGCLTCFDRGLVDG